jgi:NADH-quinone oxidoreductase subunit N
MHPPIAIRTELLTISAEQLRALAPYFVLFGGAVLAMILGVMRVIQPKWPVFIVSLAATLAAMVLSVGQLPTEALPLFNHGMLSDRFSSFFNLIFLGSAALTLLASFRYLDRENLQYPEYYILVLLSALGMMLMASATDLIVVFIALELMSLAVYVLVGFRRADRRSNEASMKYFILGSAASAILLYGAALLYGATGSTNIRDILSAVTSRPEVMSPMFAIGAWLVVIGFLFKVASVPFHMWMPDVYEGAPTPVTGFMTTGLKAAAFASFMRVFISLGYGKGLSSLLQAHVHDILWASAVLTMVVGNVVALTQTNLKRMLAYSSIAHSGYLLVGLIAAPGSGDGYAPLAMYLLAYSAMNLGAFIILTVVSGRSDQGLNLHDMAGLSRRHPWLAFSMAVFMFSMAGIPPTAGFAAKYLLFYSAIQSGEIWLVVISVLCSAISVYYYLRVLVYMYMHDPVGNSPVSRISAWSAVAVGLMVAMTVEVGVLPSRMMEAAKRAVTSL